MSAIYIHTRDRIEFLRKTLPKWPAALESDIPIFLVVEPNEQKMHRRLIEELGLLDSVETLGILGKNLGMGNSRNVAFKHAASMGYESFITTDDDLFPKDDPSILLDSATDPDTFGIGCYFSIYGMMLNLERGEGIVEVGTSIGMRCMAMNTSLVEEVGGFPIEWKGYDDQEMARRGIEELGLAWKVNSDFMCNSIAKRGDPGGMASLPGYKNPVAGKHRAHLLAKKAWPDYTSDPAKCDVDDERCSYTFRWKKFRHDNGVYINDERED